MARSPDFNSGLSAFLINLYFLGVNLTVLRMFLSRARNHPIAMRLI